MLKRPPLQESTLLRSDLKSSREAVGTIGIVLFRTNFTNYHGVADFLSFVGGNIVIVDEKESVSARNSFGGGGGS